MVSITFSLYCLHPGFASAPPAAETQKPDCFSKIRRAFYPFTFFRVHDILRLRNERERTDVCLEESCRTVQGSIPKQDTAPPRAAVPKAFAGK